MGIETWRNIKGYEGMYQVSSIGRVKSLPRMSTDNRKVNGGIIKPIRTSLGYLGVRLYSGSKRKSIQLSVLVADNFLYQESHNHTLIKYKDGNKDICTADNMEYVLPYAKIKMTASEEREKEYDTRISLNSADEYFYSLCRPRLSNIVKGRKCLVASCRAPLEKRIALYDHHLCSNCNEKNARLGAKAEAV